MPLRPTFFLLLALATPLHSHDADLPEWVRNSTSCTIDLMAAPNALEGEIDFSQKDALTVLGEKKWVKAKTSRQMAERIKAGLFVDGRPPDLVEPTAATESFEHWRVRWTGAMPRSFDVRVDLFNDMGVPGWCRIFVVPKIGDKPEQSFFFKSDQAFHWPRDITMPGMTWWRFFNLGYVHIMPLGLDHILFVLGLCLAAKRMGSLLVQVTAFTVAHTITLGLASKGVIGLAPSVVEPLIAASIVLVALENCAKKEPPRWRWAVVFAFGLVHGMGFAGVLLDAGLPAEAFLSSLLAFNLGVEAGQLTLVGLTLGFLWRLRAKSWYRKNILVPVSWGIGGAGLFWVIQRLVV